MQVPDTKVAELVDGEMFVSPRPESPHAHAATLLGGAVVGPLHRNPGTPGAPGGWWILLEPELHFGDDVLVPDWAGWRRERLPVLRDVPYFELAPDWVCEVVSPATGRLDRSRKMRIYARERIAHAWLVDPLAQTLEVYRLSAPLWTLEAVHAGGDVVRAAPFDAIELALERWWLPADPTTP